MIRRLFTLASMLSLLFCIATAALWARSYYVGYGAGRINDRAHESRRLMTFFGISVAWGGISIGREIEDVPEGADPDTMRRAANGWSHWTYARPHDALVFVDWNWRLLGFAWSSYEHYGYDARVDPPASAGTDRSQVLVIPCWFSVLVSALVPLGWLARARRVRRGRRMNLCPACGYDLRASNERCPECGGAILSKAEPPP
jgi:hypothetical protein